MSIRKDRLRLIRERHHELILAPRKKVEIDAFQEGWEDEFECFDSEDELRRFSLCDEDES